MAAALFCQQASAAEYYQQVDTTGTTVINVPAGNPGDLPLPVGHNRVLHEIVATNTDATPVTLTFVKITSNAQGQVSHIKNVVIVPAFATVSVPFPSGLYLLKTSTSLADELEVQLTTTSTTPNVGLTIDYLDI